MVINSNRLTFGLQVIMSYISPFFYPASTSNNSSRSAAQLDSIDNCTRFFSLSIHTWHVSPSTSLSLLSLISPLFSLPLPVVIELLLSLSHSTYCSRCLFLYVLLDSLSLRISLSSSLHTHTSHFLSLKRFLFLITNLQ